MSYSIGDKSFVVKYISDIFYCVFVKFVTIHIDLCEEILGRRLNVTNTGHLPNHYVNVFYTIALFYF